MLTKIQCAKYCERLGLSQDAAELLNAIRESDPARTPQGGRGNVHGRYPSRKMERTIQFESRTNELPRILFFEHDPSVLEFWDQPPKLRLSYEITTETGKRKYTGPYTPDFFVMEYGGCGWIECKTEKDLEDISSKSTRFVKDADGTWRCPPGEEIAKRYGFFFRVLSSRDINPTLYNNLLYLEDYYHVNAPKVAEGTRTAVMNAVKENPGILLTDLKTLCPTARADDFNALIACEDIYVDLEKVLLNQPERVRVFRDSSLASVLIYVDQCPKSDSDPQLRELYEGSEIRISAKRMTVAAICEDEILLRESTGKEARISKESLTHLIDIGEAALLSAPQTQTPKELQTILSRYTSGERTKGLQRFAIYSNPEEFAKVKPRTKERWRKKIREAAAQWGTSYGWVGLLPTYHNGGRPRGELSAKVINVLESSFKHWENPAAITFSAFWCLCQNTAHETNTPDMCCKKTARRWLKERQTRDSVLMREGKAVHTSTAPPLAGDNEIPPYAVRPWERVFIDHTMADIRLRLETDGPEGQTMRPYFTVMIDDYSRKILAFVIDFDPPSRDTCMHLIRECVKRHHYLPGRFALDNGKEFKSTYFQRLMSACWITPEYRPARTAKFGGRMERFFSTANTAMFHQLLGNTKAMKNPRQVTKAVNPETTAVWTLEELYKTVSHFCFETYNNQVHSTFGCTPNERFKQGLERHGERKGRHREYDESFKMLTFPSTAAGSLTVGRNGIRMFGGFSYWADGMLTALGKKVPVCYDPDDVSKVYVFLGKEWVWARAGSHHLLEKLSRRALRIATQEFFAEQKRRSSAEKLNERTLGRFLETAKAKEVIARQEKIDTDFRKTQENDSHYEPSEPSEIIVESYNPSDKAPVLQPPKPLKSLKPINVSGSETEAQTCTPANPCGPAFPASQPESESRDTPNRDVSNESPGSIPARPGM